ncbi:MAG TPA: hypothetical protein VGO00_12570 [Kofleriaceae bacterium]|nr:hypothetical protein [Kofleriaceae bacterium]
MAAVAVIAVTSIASAEPDAAALFEEGRALAAAGKQAEACAKFEQSFAIERAIGTEMNVADCHQHAGKLADAWRMFDEAARTDTKPGRAKFARERADALLAQTGEIIVRLYAPATPGLAVTIAGRHVDIATEIHERVDPGIVHIAATATDRQPFASDTQVAAGAAARVDVPPLSSSPAVITPPPPQPPVVTVPVASSTHLRRSRVIAAATLGGAGVVAIAVAGGLAISARGSYRDAFSNGSCTNGASGPVCNDAGFTATHDAGTRADLATGVAIGGAVLIGAAAAVLFTAPRDADVDALHATVVVGPSWGFAVAGRF